MISTSYIRCSRVYVRPLAACSHGIFSLTHIALHANWLHYTLMIFRVPRRRGVGGRVCAQHAFRAPSIQYNPIILARRPPEKYSTLVGLLGRLGK